jgi:hypothetical protein
METFSPELHHFGLYSYYHLPRRYILLQLYETS